MVNCSSLLTKPGLAPSNPTNDCLPTNLASTEPVIVSQHPLMLRIDYDAVQSIAEQCALSEAGTDAERHTPDTPGYGELTTVGGQVAYLFGEPSTPKMANITRRSTLEVDLREFSMNVSPASLRVRVKGHAVGDIDSLLQRRHYTTTSTPRVSEGFSSGGPRRPKSAAPESTPCDSDISRTNTLGLALHEVRCGALFQAKAPRLS